MPIENANGHGSMYGVVDSMHNMTDAMEALLLHLPADFVWPTIFNVSPFSAYAEWGRDDSTSGSTERAVWLVASPEGVVMNANFRPGWPDCGAADFDAQTAAEWLQQLTNNWEWEASREGGRTSSSMRRG